MSIWEHTKKEGQESIRDMNEYFEVRKGKKWIVTLVLIWHDHKLVLVQENEHRMGKEVQMEHQVSLDIGLVVESRKEGLAILR